MEVGKSNRDTWGRRTIPPARPLSGDLGGTKAHTMGIAKGESCKRIKGHLLELCAALDFLALNGDFTASTLASKVVRLPVTNALSSRASTYEKRSPWSLLIIFLSAPYHRLPYLGDWEDING